MRLIEIYNNRVHKTAYRLTTNPSEANKQQLADVIIEEGRELADYLTEQETRD